MRISFDNHTPAAVVRPTDGSIFAFDGKTPPPTAATAPLHGFNGPTAAMFAYLGGEQLRKCGKRGTLGGGTLPDEGLSKCGVLVTCTDRPKKPLLAPVNDGVRCIVATHKERITEASVVFVVHESVVNGIELFVGVNQPASVSQMLNQPDQLRAGSGQRKTLKAYGLFDGSERMKLRRLGVTIYGSLQQVGRLTPERILDLLFWDHLYSEGAMILPVRPWERELGLAVGIDCKIYRNHGGILRDPIEFRDAQRVFKRVCFVTDPRPGAARPSDLYLIRRKKRGWILVGSYPLRGGSDESKYWIAVSPHDAQEICRTGELIERLHRRVLPPPELGV